MSEDAIRRRSFPEAFKREAVAAIRGGRSVSQVAAELGLADRLVRSWLRWAEDHPAEASGAPAPPSRAQAAPMRRVGASPADQAAGPVLHGSVSAASTAAASRSSARAKPPSSLPRAAASHGRNAAWSRVLIMAQNGRARRTACSISGVAETSRLTKWRRASRLIYPRPGPAAPPDGWSAPAGSGGAWPAPRPATAAARGPSRIPCCDHRESPAPGDRATAGCRSRHPSSHRRAKYAW